MTAVFSCQVSYKEIRVYEQTNGLIAVKNMYRTELFNHYYVGSSPILTSSGLPILLI